MRVSVDQEVEVAVTAVLSWGLSVVTRDGEDGFIDALKIPADFESAGTPAVGDSLTVVVLDDCRVPFRASFLAKDFVLAAEARGDR